MDVINLPGDLERWRLSLDLLRCRRGLLLRWRSLRGDGLSTYDKRDIHQPIRINYKHSGLKDLADHLLCFSYCQQGFQTYLRLFGDLLLLEENKPQCV